MNFSVRDGSYSEVGPFLPIIKVIGVGGAGNNAVANMIRFGLSDVEFIVANTDLQVLSISPCNNRIQLGRYRTAGLGAGSDPKVGVSSAEESKSEIEEVLRDAHVVFIAAGMGGGTGTGAAPVIARIAREMGIMTIGVVTKPFSFEGSNRMRIAMSGITELESEVDILVVVSNQNLFRIVEGGMSFKDACQEADNILYNGVRCIADLFTKPGLINLDLADVRSVMSSRGLAMIGIGEASGKDRAMKAIELATTNPLLEGVAINEVESVLLNISGGDSLSLLEVEKIASYVSDIVGSDNGNFLFGATVDEDLGDSIKVSIIATGVRKDDKNYSLRNRSDSNKQDMDVSVTGGSESFYNATSGMANVPIYSNISDEEHQFSDADEFSSFDENDSDEISDDDKNDNDNDSEYEEEVNSETESEEEFEEEGDDQMTEYFNNESAEANFSAEDETNDSDNNELSSDFDAVDESQDFEEEDESSNVKKQLTWKDRLVLNNKSNEDFSSDIPNSIYNSNNEIFLEVGGGKLESSFANDSEIGMEYKSQIKFKQNNEISGNNIAKLIRNNNAVKMQNADVNITNDIDKNITLEQEEVETFNENHLNKITWDRNLSVDESEDEPILMKSFWRSVKERVQGRKDHYEQKNELKKKTGQYSGFIN